MTGDEKDACEAILCLSPEERPDECAPSLNRYFSIKKKTTSKTIKAREDFLSKCPVVDEDNEMRQRVAQIAQGAGCCDAAFLNQSLREFITVKKCYAYSKVGNRLPLTSSCARI
ncbi:MAG: hypothetical protein LBJ59_03410 [Zoogloeaceae bacterium]|nr:hypothetical protein [Zoogloeaceae bacterium]